jgi:hypothetical protein
VAIAASNIVSFVRPFRTGKAFLHFVAAAHSARAGRVAARSEITAADGANQAAKHDAGRHKTHKE